MCCGQYMHCFVGNLFRCKSAKNYKIRLRYMIFCLILQYQVSTTVMDLVVVFALFVFMPVLLFFDATVSSANRFIFHKAIST